MLLALIFRGVAFEFRFKSSGNRHWWDRAFAYGSMAATFAQGVVLGSFIQGVEVVDRAYAGSAPCLAHPLLAVLRPGAHGRLRHAGGGLADRQDRRAAAGAGPTARCASPALLHARRGRRRLALDAADPRRDRRRAGSPGPTSLYLSPVPLLVLLVAWRLYRALERREHWSPFLLTLVLFLLSYAGLAISLFPYVIPPEITIWDAASPRSSQLFLLVGHGRSCCRSSWPTPATTTGCSAANRQTKAATSIERPPLAIPAIVVRHAVVRWCNHPGDGGDSRSNRDRCHWLIAAATA